ncbi:nucleoside triphosphate pyrophosphohydrolase [bacterium]|nr:nucleoside triphosphate pyrophosphohydrolase [bacterium]
MNGTQKLINTMRQLRDPKHGCPWDKAQTHKTLIPYFFEELHEYQEAVLEESPQSAHFQEELGDLLFQIAFHAQLLEEAQITSFDQLASKVADKLIRRHPHVFDPNAERFQDASAVEKQWEQRKQKEKSGQKTAWESLKKIPASMGALARAQRIGEKAASFGFDWENATQVLAKVAEEIEEINSSQNEAEAQEEFGDLLFALGQYARKRGWNAETCVSQCNQKFVSRFRAMEEKSTKVGLQLTDLSMDELESLWQSVKV